MKGLIFFWPLIFLGTSAHAFTLITSGGITTVGWKKNTVTVYVNYTDCPSEAAMNERLDFAMGVWNSVKSADVQLVRGRSLTDAEAASSMSVANGNPIAFCSGLLGELLGSPGVAVADNGTMQFGYFYVNASKGASDAFVNDLGKVVFVHLLGHMLGIGFSPVASSIMQNPIPTVFQPGLDQDDMDALTYLYPRSNISFCGFLGHGTAGVGILGGLVLFAYLLTHGVRLRLSENESLLAL